MGDSSAIAARAMALTLGRHARASVASPEWTAVARVPPLRQRPLTVAHRTPGKPTEANVVFLRWETVRMYGEIEPEELESGVRRALAAVGGRWKVAIGRSKTWFIRLERETPGTGALRSVQVNLAVSTATAAAVEGALIDLLRDVHEV